MTVGDGVGTGKVYHYVNGKYDLHQRVYRMFDFKNGMLAKYFYHHFSNHFYDRVMAMTAKTSVDSVRYEMISEMTIEMPSEKEQTRIIDYLDNLDNLITLHRRKPCFIILLFENHNEVVPYDWEQRKLWEVVDVRGGKDYKHLSEGDIPVYGTGGYMLSVNEALSYKEDAIGIGRKGTIDKPYILKAPFWTVDTLFYAVPKENHDLDFAFDLFQNIDWKKKDESTGVPSLSKTAINEIDVILPKENEQKVIGVYFAQIDNLITLHQRKYEKLQNLKKACLEKMFV